MFYISRYIAVHFPLRRLYLQKNKRTLKYIISVVLLSSLFTATRFFEVEVGTEKDLYSNSTIKDNKTMMFLKPTELRLNPTYVKYYNWCRLTVHGLVPFLMLVYLNGLMYQDIKSRRKDWEYKENNDREITITDAVAFNENGVIVVEGSPTEEQGDCFEMKETKVQLPK